MAHVSPPQEQSNAATVVKQPESTRREAPGTSLPSHPSRWWLPRKRYVLLGLLSLLLAGAAPYAQRLWQYYQTHVSTDNAYVVSDIIPVSARVPGAVRSVYVADHQQVVAGQLLAQLDPRDFETRVHQAEAAVAVAASRLRQAEIDVTREQDYTGSDTARTSAALRGARSTVREAQYGIDAAQAQLRMREAVVAVAQADVDTWQAHVDMAHIEFKRTRQLLADGIVAQQQFDVADSAQRTAQAEQHAARQKLVQAQREVERAQVELRLRYQGVEREQQQVAAAQARLAGSQANQQNVHIKQAQVEAARALLQQAQADLEYARLQLDYTTLRAPEAGVVAKMHLQVGEVVRAGRPLLAIVAQQQVWVEANFKETQLQRMRPGQKATLQVDAYPEHVFLGTVASLSPGTGAIFSLLPPENATGNFVKIVQRLPVKILLDNPTPYDPVLRPGMSVVATIAIAN